MAIIWIILVEFKKPMLHTKFQDNASIGTEEDDIYMFLYTLRRPVVLCRALHLSVCPDVRPLTFRVRSITLIPFKIFS